MEKKCLMKTFTASLLTMGLIASMGTSVLAADPSGISVVSPDSFLGYKLGSDYHLTQWDTIVNYMQKLADSSNRVQLVRYGKTAMGKDMIYTVISSEDTFPKLDEYKTILKKLSDSRGLSEEDAKALSATGKPVYWLSANIHSTEVGSAEMAMELAYRLATADDGTLKDIVDNLIVIIDPSINPDGHDLYTNWYNTYVGTEWEDSRAPYYGKYVSHDNNRDWFALNLVETRQEIAERNKWMPTIFHDLHQSGPARMWVNPTTDPNDPNISPITQSQWNLFGGYIVAQMTASGFPGVAMGEPYDNWYPGYHDSPTTYHSGMGMLFETHGGTGASPEKASPKKGEVRSMLQPFPWEGGWWRLRNNIDWQENGAIFSMEMAVQLKEDLLFDMYRKGKEAVKLGETTAPYAFILPAKQKNPVALAELLQNLRDQLVEVNQATADFYIGRTRYKAGDYIIYMNQPFGRLAKSLLEVQKYVTDKKPYDVTAWSYGLMRGVDIVEAKDKGVYSAETKLVDSINAAWSFKNDAGADAAFLITYQGNNNVMRALNSFWSKNYKVLKATGDGKIGNVSFSGGDILVSGITEAEMKTMAEMEGLNVSGVISSSIPAGFAVLNQPRIALYYGNVDTMDEGWTRLILDKYGFSYERLNNEAIQKNNLSDYTAIIIPDMNPKNVYEGSAAMPPEYKGGIEAKGIANLRSYVKAGGRLIAMGKASQVPILYNIGIGVELADVSTVNAPGSLLKLNVAKTPFGYGFGESTPAFYEADPAFIVKEGVILATYADDTLMSGYLSDEKKVLPGKAAAVDAPLGKGDVVLLAPDFTYRDQATATIPFLWNAILL